MLNLFVRLSLAVPVTIPPREEIVDKINSNPQLKWALLGLSVTLVSFIIFLTLLSFS